MWWHINLVHATILGLILLVIWLILNKQRS